METSKEVMTIPKPPSPGEEAFALHCRALGFFPQREHRFCPPRRWKFDFAFVDEKIAVEIEGGTWNGGRHTRGSGFIKDCEKYNAAAILGWKVLRYTTEMVMDATAIDDIEAMMDDIKEIQG